MSKKFINYAHRGASAYCPENTLSAFYTAIYMHANGIETDIQQTKDHVLVLFHDDAIFRLTGEPGCIQDYTYKELQEMSLMHNDITDKIVSLETFLQQFAWRDLSLALELKQPYIEGEVSDMVHYYHAEQKSVITSFDFDCLQRMRNCSANLELGYLTPVVNDTIIRKLKQIDARELCPHSALLNTESTISWHNEGFRVRAWGIPDIATMQHVYNCNADGMTVNFPDQLYALMQKNGKESSHTILS